MAKVATPAASAAAAARLRFLEELGLAQRQAGEYHLSPGWEDSLAVSRRFSSYLEAAKQLRFTARSLLRLYSPDQDGRIVGHVSAIGLIDELSTNNYVLVETIDGRAFYVPLLRQPRGISVGDSIALMRIPNTSPIGGEVPAQETSVGPARPMRLLDVHFTRVPEERLKAEARGIGTRRGGFGLHLF